MESAAAPVGAGPHVLAVLHLVDGADAGSSLGETDMNLEFNVREAANDSEEVASDGMPAADGRVSELMTELEEALASIATPYVMRSVVDRLQKVVDACRVVGESSPLRPARLPFTGTAEYSEANSAVSSAACNAFGSARSQDTLSAVGSVASSMASRCLSMISNMSTNPHIRDVKLPIPATMVLSEMYDI
mmetsp:Transcript_34783/g.79580  ORF Transcript_34783/g.79580 Transcript_34783/m.79580 type:complete len:190 (-) Transcript_34783:399-968(-)